MGVIPAMCRYSVRPIAGYVPRMEKPKQPIPEKLDLRLPTELRTRLDDRAQQESRSRNAQAAYYIKCGLDGYDLREMTESIRRIERGMEEMRRALESLLNR